MRYPKAKKGFVLNTPMLQKAYRENASFREYADKLDPNESRGLGDTIYKILEKLGVHKVMKKTKRGRRGCGGCAKRRAKLNKLVPYASSTRTQDLPADGTTDTSA